MAKWTVKLISSIEPILQRTKPAVNWLQTITTHSQASKLNRELYRDAKEIDSNYLRTVRELIRNFGIERGLDPARIDHWVLHTKRLILSKKWLNEIVDTFSGDGFALDLGPPSVATDYWRYEFPFLEWQSTPWDLRYPWQISSGTINLICCTELIEHLSDPPNEIYNEGFYQVGFRDMLAESYRVLTPGGYFFGTTPNAASVCHLEAVLYGQPPWLNQKHVHEYTLNEISYQFARAGFEIIKADDIHCISINQWKDYTSFFTMLLSHDYVVDGRGDALFFIAKKTE